MNLAEKRGKYIKDYGLILEDESLNFQAYTWQGLGMCLLMVFWGKAAKPQMHFKYTGADAWANAHERANDFLTTQRQKKEADKAQKLKNAANHEMALDINDILVCSWGWEQTNVDYYQVTKLVGKKSVAVRAIGKDSKEFSNSMTGTCTPLPSSFRGEAFTCRVIEGRTIKISRSQYATLKPYTLDVGKRIYKADQWTAYA